MSPKPSRDQAFGPFARILTLDDNVLRDEAEVKHSAVRSSASAAKPVHRYLGGAIVDVPPHEGGAVATVGGTF
jgi:hypothetical protein